MADPDPDLDRAPAPGRPHPGRALPTVPDQDAVAALRTELAAIRRGLDDVGLRDGPASAVGPDRSGRRGRRLGPALGVALGVVALAAVLVVALALTRGSGASELGSTVVGTPGTDALVRISGTGTIAVEESAVLARPAVGVLLTLPDPAQVRSSRLRAPSVVRLQATSERGPLTVGGGGGRWTVTAPDGRPVSRVTLRYGLDGAVLDAGGGGRALVVVTPLTAGLSRQGGGEVVVRATGALVRQATCIGAAVADQICGSRTEAGWTARIPASSPVPFVLLQVDLKLSATGEGAGTVG